MSNNEILIIGLIQIIPFVLMVIVDIPLTKARGDNYKVPYGEWKIYPILLGFPIVGAILSTVLCISRLMELISLNKSSKQSRM